MRTQDKDDAGALVDVVPELGGGADEGGSQASEHAKHDAERPMQDVPDLAAFACDRNVDEDGVACDCDRICEPPGNARVSHNRAHRHWQSAGELVILLEQ